MDLQTPIREVSRSYKIYARRLEKLGIRKLEDFLYHIPFRYEDFSIISKISDLQPGETVTVKGEVIEIKNQYTRRFKTIQRAKIKDSSGTLDIIWFNQPYIPKSVNQGNLISVSGKAGENKGVILMQSPEYEVIEDLQSKTIHTGRLVPIYPETRGISSKWLRRQTHTVFLAHKDKITEYFPYSILKKAELIALNKAIEQIHFPNSLEEVIQGKNRLSFDELFFLHLAGLYKKKEWEKPSDYTPLNYLNFKKKLEIFINKLPYKLTNAQEKTVSQIISDLTSQKPMNRLLQGDVGSGKTIVATIAMYLCFLNGFKSILMAPTEILAQQHFKTISDLLLPFGIKVELLTGNQKVKNNNFDILIGTHAVLYSKLNLKNLKLVVVDEQQRFGVTQRSQIRKKGEGVNFLTMTATPIPRTVALTLYGNLSLSYLDEMPKGRIKIKTWLVPPIKRASAYKWIEEQIKSGNQAFIICPFIEESESMQTVKAAKIEYERLTQLIFPTIKLGILHGKLSSKEKDDVLNKFKNKEIDILVSTPVVEVGIDIPNATIMVIEEAERFGLAQLHQLRGRVGRSSKQSYCLLFTSSTNEKTLKRIKAMETMHLGRELAELDLKLRGPGTLYGVLQHGALELKVASFSDFDLIEKTKKIALEIFPKIHEFPELYKKVQRIEKLEVSPD